MDSTSSVLESLRSEMLLARKASFVVHTHGAPPGSPGGEGSYPAPRMAGASSYTVSLGSPLAGAGSPRVSFLPRT